MWFFLVLVGAPFLLGLVPGTAATIPIISAIGSKFFDSSGNQFFIKGTVHFSFYNYSFTYLTPMFSWHLTI
jgi:hypothetical protein